MALVIWHVQPDGQPNHLAWHAACQALDGGHRYALQKFKVRSVCGRIGLTCNTCVELSRVLPVGVSVGSACS